MNIKTSCQSLSTFEKNLWFSSLSVITAVFLLCGTADLLTLATSLIGVTALIFTAKGDAFGQLLTLLFAILYSIISWRLRYYGEMITYLGMTAPIAALAVITWRKNPYSATQVRVGKMTIKGCLLLFSCAGLATWGGYYLLAALNTANLFFSTLSIATSFLAASLTVFRSPSYAIAYAANDVVLIILWALAAQNDSSFLPVTACFVMFFINDIYGFVSWRKIEIRQNASIG